MHRDLKPQNILVHTSSSASPSSGTRQPQNNQETKIELKLGDFGLARSFGIPVRKLSHEVVTLWYRSIDILFGSQSYGFGVDIWSIGCIFAEMVTGKPLFTGKDEVSQLTSIISKMGLPTTNEWPDLRQLPNYEPMMNKILKKTSITSNGRISKEQFGDVILQKKLDAAGVDLMYRMLEYDPNKRPSATECLKHPYFNTN